MKSNAYRLSSKFDGEWKPEYANYYPRKFVRMLSAAELHDSIVTATARPGSYKSGVDDVATAMALLDPAHVNREVKEFLRAFGQQSRDSLPAKTARSSLQAMLMMNSQVVLDRVKAEGNSRVDQLLGRLEDDRIVIEQSFRTAIGREPSAVERETGSRPRLGGEDLPGDAVAAPVAGGDGYRTECSA